MLTEQYVEQGKEGYEKVIALCDHFSKCKIKQQTKLIIILNPFWINNSVLTHFSLELNC